MIGNTAVQAHARIFPISGNATLLLQRMRQACPSRHMLSGHWLHSTPDMSQAMQVSMLACLYLSHSTCVCSIKRSGIISQACSMVSFRSCNVCRTPTPTTYCRARCRSPMAPCTWSWWKPYAPTSPPSVPPPTENASCPRSMSSSDSLTARNCSLPAQSGCIAA